MRWAIALLLAAGCDVRVLNFEGDGGSVDVTIHVRPDGNCEPIPEQCNGLDDDCDCRGDTNDDGVVCGTGDDGVDEDDPGTPDDDLPNVGQGCGSEIGECTVGITVCAPTPGCIQRGDCVGCSGNVSTKPEECNLLDDDCDGETDNGFNFCDSPLTCGDCFTDCTAKDPATFHATFDCQACTVPAVPCKIVGCLPGYANCNGLDNDGCECPCGLERPGPEICDGEDNDCDGDVDTADPSMLAPPFCRQTGECSGTVAQCVFDARCATCTGQPDPETCWICDYGPTVEISATDPCRPSNVELLCDDLDGNCNLLVDEGFPLKDTDCNNGEIGSCAVQGQWICDPSDTTATVCSVEGVPGPPPANELCDGEDNNCNGITDENQDDAPSATLGVRDDFIHITRGAPALDIYMYRYEASRPGATDAAPGNFQHRACSRTSVIPWGSVTRDEAITACAAAGLRLCTEAEWDAACYGTAAPAAGDDFPYGEPYSATACNGKELDPTCPNGDDCAVPTGSLATCDTPEGIFDLSGNLKEWTEDPEPDVGPVEGYRPRGGSFDNIAGGMSCDFKFTVLPTDFRHENLGFRCCCTTGATCPPP